MTVDEILELEDFHLSEPSPYWDGWENVHDGHRARLEAISSLVTRHIGTSELVVLVLVDPLLGSVLPAAEAANYIGSRVLEGEIQISDVHFKSFVFIARNGTALGWKSDAVRLGKNVG